MVILPMAIACLRHTAGGRGEFSLLSALLCLLLAPQICAHLHLHVEVQVQVQVQGRLRYIKAS